MIGYNRYVTLPLISLLTLCTVTAHAQALEDRDWLEVRTANFQVRSVLSEKHTLELARQLEMFRAAVTITTRTERKSDPIPTVIYAIGAEGDLTRLGIKQTRSGLFKRALRNNTIIIRDVNSLQETNTILHDYVHFLASDGDNLLHPKWFNEGFAEHLSTIRVRRDVFEIGLVTKHRKKTIRKASWIPLQDILTATNYYDKWNVQERAMFHAEAWALVYYLLNRSDRPGSLATDMQRYLDLVELGEEGTTAFEQAFGVKTERLNSEVKRYLKRGKFDAFAFRIDTLLPVFEAAVVKLSRAQAALGLGQIALSNGALATADHWFNIAIASARTRARAEAGLGDVLKFRNDFVAAEPRFAQAVALAPDNPYGQLDLGEYWHYRAIKTTEAVQRKNFLTRAQSHYAKALELDDSIPEIYAMHGQTFLMQGGYGEAIELLEEAHQRLPSALDIRLILAEAYAAADRKQDSAKAVRSVLIWSHKDRVVIDHARDIIARLGTREEQRTVSAKPASENGSKW